MENFNMDYSGKNIPLPSNKDYLKRLLEMTESLIKRMRWKAFYFLRKEDASDHSSDSSSDTSNCDDDTHTEFFGLKSKRTPPPIQEMVSFESDLLSMVENIQFRKVNDNFQSD